MNAMANRNDNNTISSGALLSKKQREWLDAGAPDPNTSAHRALRVRIRERLLQSFLDFTLLRNLPDGDIEKAFQSEKAWRTHAHGMIAALALIYDVSRDGIWGEGTESFEPMLKRAIRDVEYDPDDRTPHALAIEVLFEHDTIVVNKPLVSNFDLDEIGEKIANDEMNDLSRAELAWFISFYKQEGGLDPQYPARVRERATRLVGKKLPTEESRKQRNQLAAEMFEDSGNIEELRESAEKLAEQRQARSDDQTDDK